MTISACLQLVQKLNAMNSFLQSKQKNTSEGPWLSARLKHGHISLVRGKTYGRKKAHTNKEQECCKVHRNRKCNIEILTAAHCQEILELCTDYEEPALVGIVGSEARNTVQSRLSEKDNLKSWLTNYPPTKDC